MRRTSTWLLAALVALSGALGGCMVRHHGHLSWVVPPLVAAAVVASRPGHVWIEGHWDWVNNGWIWSDGYWVAERPGYAWEPGVWLRIDTGYHYRPGRWRAHDRIEVRDHRDHRK